MFAAVAVVHLARAGVAQLVVHGPGVLHLVCCVGSRCHRLGLHRCRTPRRRHLGRDDPTDIVVHAHPIHRVEVGRSVSTRGCDEAASIHPRRRCVMKADGAPACIETRGASESTPPVPGSVVVLHPGPPRGVRNNAPLTAPLRRQVPAPTSGVAAYTESGSCTDNHIRAGVGADQHLDPVGTGAESSTGVVEVGDLLPREPLACRTFGAVLRHSVAVAVTTPPDRQ